MSLKLNLYVNLRQLISATEYLMSVTTLFMGHKQDCNEHLSVFSANEHFLSLLRKLYIVLYTTPSGDLDDSELGIISSLPLSHNYYIILTFCGGALMWIDLKGLFKYLKLGRRK